MDIRRIPVVATIVALAASSSAGAISVPFDVQVPLLLKALTYDRNLKVRSGDQVRIAVLVPAKGGRAAAQDLVDAVSHLPDRTVNGMPVSFKEVVVTDEAALEHGLQGRWAAAYVMPGFNREDLAAIRRVCEARRVLAVAASVEEVERGLSFGVGAQGGRPQIVVNLPSSRACGSEFDLALLRLARVIQ